MSTSQANIGGIPTNIDAAIKLAVFEDNWIQGLYDIDHFHFEGPTAAGMRLFTRQRPRNSRRWQNVALLITDWISSSDPVTLAYIASGGVAGGMPVTRTGFAGASDVGLVVRPAYSLTTAATQSGNWFVKINSTGVAAPSGGQFTTNGLGTAQLLSSFANPPPGFADTFIIENLDAVNTVWLGNSAVTNSGANIGFPLTKGLTSPPIQNSAPANLYVIDNGLAVTCAWLAM